MQVYNIVLANTMIKPTIYELDMLKLLNNQEVLTFGFNDIKETSSHTHNQFGHIFVQAKDLKVYEIDYEDGCMCQVIENT